MPTDFILQFPAEATLLNELSVKWKQQVNQRHDELYSKYGGALDLEVWSCCLSLGTPWPSRLILLRIDFKTILVFAFLYFIGIHISIHDRRLREVFAQNLWSVWLHFSVFLWTHVPVHCSMHSCWLFNRIVGTMVTFHEWNPISQTLSFSNLLITQPKLVFL